MTLYKPPPRAVSRAYTRRGVGQWSWQSSRWVESRVMRNMEMAEYWVVYKDIEDSEPRQSFEMMAAPQPGEPVIKSEVLPGALGEKDVYIRRNGRRIGVDEIHLLTYTHQELNPREVRNLMNQALNFAQDKSI
jgi:hypothetical protein